MDVWKLKEALSAAILLIIRAHPAGFRVLLGDYPPPDDEEICGMLGLLRDDDDPAMRVDGGVPQPEAVRMLESADRFSRVIEYAGGWPHINRVCREWAAHYKTTWRLLIEHAKWVTGAFSRIDNSQLVRLAKEHRVSKDTVCRHIRGFPGELAGAILRQPVEAPVPDAPGQ